MLWGNNSSVELLPHDRPNVHRKQQKEGELMKDNDAQLLTEIHQNVQEGKQRKKRGKHKQRHKIEETKSLQVATLSICIYT